MSPLGGGGGIPRRSLLLGAAALAACTPRPEITGGFSGGASHELGHRLRDPQDPGAARTSRRTQVVIAGAGIAGLAAARALRQRGIEDFVLLDLEAQPGGNSRSGMVEGITCPLGAHYLPLPGDAAREVQELLEELGLRRRVAGRWSYDERYLCHSPQERLHFHGEWQDGLLPVQGVSRETLAQYQRFARLVEAERRQVGFAIPVASHGARGHAALDALTFAAWLDRQGLADAQLRWYLDYCCRDDYGAGTDTVSAWAGVHYFAARHGFSAPGVGESAPDVPLTWPEGNAWLARALAAPLGDRWRSRQLVLRIAEQAHGVEVDVLDAGKGGVERWNAAQCIVALPALVAHRVVESPPAWLQAKARATRYAPWLVANLHLRQPLADGSGAPRAWDNVVFGSRSLGYVDAMHQALSPLPAPTVLTWYLAPGEAARPDLLAQPWTAWRDRVLAELTPVHPDLPAKLTRIEVTRYGHAMAIPVPGGLAHAGPAPATARLRFAHSDWSGYSIFEEAFTQGHLAGRAV